MHTRFFESHGCGLDCQSRYSKCPAGAHEVVVQGRANNGATRGLSSIIVSVKS
jgi:hypothetical protein